MKTSDRVRASTFHHNLQTREAALRSHRESRNWSTFSRTFSRTWSGKVCEVVVPEEEMQFRDLFGVESTAEEEEQGGSGRRSNGGDWSSSSSSDISVRSCVIDISFWFDLSWIQIREEEEEEEEALGV